MSELATANTEFHDPERIKLLTDLKAVLNCNVSSTVHAHLWLSDIDELKALVDVERRRSGSAEAIFRVTDKDAKTIGKCESVSVYTFSWCRFAKCYTGTQRNRGQSTPQQSSSRPGTPTSQKQAIPQSPLTLGGLKRKAIDEQSENSAVRRSKAERELVSLLQLIPEFQLIISSVIKETVDTVCSRETVSVKLHTYTPSQCPTSHQPLLTHSTFGKCCSTSGPTVIYRNGETQSFEIRTIRIKVLRHVATSYAFLVMRMHIGRKHISLLSQSNSRRTRKVWMWNSTGCQNTTIRLLLYLIF
jgi:hypothetical protein